MQSFVDNSSKSAVDSGASLIKNHHLSHGRFLNTSNPLLHQDLDDVIKKHFNGTQVLPNSEVSTYLASSSLVHSIDGWIYLAHSIESLLKGDLGVASHLAYYSELRAAMSFLASEGIAVLNHYHIGLDVAGVVLSPLPLNQKQPGTHSFAWQALHKYIQSTNKNKDAILKVFYFQGKNFYEWLSAIPNSNTVISDQVVKDWLKEWSFDIQLYDSDKNLRNEYSYRPKKITQNQFINLDDVLRKLSSFWNLLEPQNVERFGLLDQYLLKKLFQKTHHYIEIALGRTVDFNSMIEETFRRLRLTYSPQLKSFFNSPNDHTLFSSAVNTAVDPILGVDPFSILARSTLLLRLTIGYSSNTLVNAGITKGDLDFFFDSIGSNCGFWINNRIPSDFIELWSDDFRDAINEVENWLSGRTTIGTFNEINNELSNELTCYTQINRASFWGISF